MSIIKWNEELNIGVAHIDEQHKQLIHAINELQLAVEYGRSHEVLQPLMARLFDYADTHFRAEELLFADLHYQGVAAHKQEHLSFLAKLQELSKQFDYNKEFLAVHIKDFLLAWFYNHILTKDMEYKQLMP